MSFDREDELPLCPHCGLTRVTFVSGRARGQIERFYSGKGEHMNEDLDKVWAEFNSVPRCCLCRKVRTDVRFTASGMLVGKETK